MCNTGNTINREQWKRGGDCRLCRRQPYCKKWCTAHKQRTNNLMGQIIARSLSRTLAKKPKEGVTNDPV